MTILWHKFGKASHVKVTEMKNTLLVLFILNSICFQAYCQNQLKIFDDCSFLENLHFKKGTDTVVVKATILELGKMSDRENLWDLEKIGKLKTKDFGYAIHFQPVNCAKAFYISSRDTSIVALSLFNPRTIGQQYLLTCVIYQDYKLFDYPFFIIEKVMKE